MHQAVTTGTNCSSTDTLPLTHLTGSREELGKLRQWTPMTAVAAQPGNAA
ncbi:hypothetical protein ABZU25_32935 [Micromonospora sp. NPDC005215]